MAEADAIEWRRWTTLQRHGVRWAMEMLLRIAVTLGIALASSGCGMLLSVFGKPKVEDVRPRLEAIDLDGVTVRFDASVRNPYWFALRVPLVECGLDIEGREFVRAVSPVSVRLPARSSGRVSAPVRVRYADLLSTYRSLRGASEAEYDLHGDVSCRVLGRSFVVPLSKKGKFPIVRAPRIEDVRFRVVEASLARVVLAVEATVTNPNAFEVRLDGVGYTLALGDAEVAGLKASTAGALGPGQQGSLALTAEVAAAGTALRLLRGGGGMGKPELRPTGAIRTPYGTVKLGRRKDRE